MIYQIFGNLIGKKDNFAVVQAGGVGYKVFIPKQSLVALPVVGHEVTFFCHHRVSENDVSLYGFQTEEELQFFEQLISVSGVGPKSALSIFEISALPDLLAAIKEGRPDLLTKAAGVGRKTAERIIVELRNKVVVSGAEGKVSKMETDTDLVETLAGLGFKRDAAASALSKISEDVKGVEARLKAALKVLKQN